jgi:hypothetical protein
MFSIGGVLTALVVWSLAGLLLWWGWLPGPLRRALALLTSAAGIFFLVCALRSEGVRETTTTVAFLMGPPSVTEPSIASASLSYYILTALCLLLGTLGLAAGEGTNRALRKHALSLSIGLSLGMAVLRFFLEKVAAHRILVRGMGVVWLPPIVGAFFSWTLRAEGKGMRDVARNLVIYAVSVRAFVAGFIILATALRLGSHYDVSAAVRILFLGTAVEFEPGSLRQVLDLGVLPQFIFWTTFTVVTGLAGALVERLVALPGASVGGQPQDLAPAAKD